MKKGSFILLKNGPEFSIQLKKQERLEYITICENIWGVVPVDVVWARATKIYNDEKRRIETI